jgi:chromosome segregation ATPase
MDTYKQAINELRKIIEKNTTEIHLCLRKLGEYLSYREAGVLSTPEMEELHRRIQDLRHQLPESRQKVKKILQSVARNEELEREIRDRKAHIAELAGKDQVICEAIGRAAYTAYRSLTAPRQEYLELFEPLRRQEQELEELEAEYEKLQAHTKGGKFFRIFREAGRSLYLKGVLSLRRKAVSKSFHEVGKRFCDSELGVELKDRGLREALVPYEVNEKKIDALHRETEKLREDQGRMWNELKTLGADRSHQKRVREIETEIQRIERQLHDAFEALGSSFRGTRSGDFNDIEASSTVKQIERIEQANRRYRKQIVRLRAAMQIDSLRDRLGNLSDRISKLAADIESRQREIDTLRVQASEGEKEIQRLQKVRGSEQTLLKNPKGAVEEE